VIQKFASLQTLIDFGHTNIIKHCNRPFSSVEEMDQTMIGNWNKMVSPQDTVIHLGDFSFKSSDNVEKYVKKLNGHKILLLGNHDKYDSVKNAGFLKVVNGHLDFKFFDEKTNKKWVVFLFHYPCLSWRGSSHLEGPIHFHGHIHKSPYKTYDHVGFHPGSYDVGVDNNNFEPINILDAIEIVNKQKNENFEQDKKIGYLF